MSTVRVVRSVSWVLVFVVLGAALASWFTPRPGLDACEASDVAVAALRSVGVEGRVDDDPVLDEHDPATSDPAAAWFVPVLVGDDEIELRVHEDAGQVVYVDDRIGADRSDRLLTDRQFARLAEYRNDDTGDWVARNGFGSAAAVVVAGIAFVIAKRSDRLWPTDGRVAP